MKLKKAYIKNAIPSATMQIPRGSSSVSRNIAVVIIIVVILVAGAAGYFALTSTPSKTTTTTSTTNNTSTPTTSTSTSTTTSKGVLNVAVQSEELTTGQDFDPRYTTKGSALVSGVFSQVCEDLIIQDFNGNYLPWLATNWTVSPNQMTYTFHLRQNVQFQDGTPFNATAVAYTYNAAINTSVVGNQLGKNLNMIKNISVIDTYTVAFNLKAPSITFLFYMAISPGVVSPSAAMKMGNGIKTHPVCTGPFTFVSWTQGQSVVLTANNNYWGGAPPFSGIVFHVVPDPTVQAIELEKGQLNFIEVPGSLAQSLKAAGGVNLLQGAPATAYILAMNVNLSGGSYNAPLRNQLVREAINYAINRTAIIQAVEDGYGVPAITSVPPSLPQWNASLKVFPDGGNITKAKELMTQAGYANGLQLSLLESPYLNEDQMGAVIQSDLKQIGITLTITDEDFGLVGHQLLTHSPAWQLSIHDIFLASLSRTNDYYNSANAIPFAFNLQAVNDSTLDQLLSNMLNPSMQQATVLQQNTNLVQERILSQAYGAWLYYPERLFATTSNLVGFKPHPDEYYQMMIWQPLIGLNTQLTQASGSGAVGASLPVAVLLAEIMMSSLLLVAAAVGELPRLGAMLRHNPYIVY